jgi:hypothetical protein
MFLLELNCMLKLYNQLSRPFYRQENIFFFKSESVISCWYKKSVFLCRFKNYKISLVTKCT